MPILKPPSPLEWDPSRFSIFLAGSIDNGAAPNWQADVESALAFWDPVILNPRRDDWDPNQTDLAPQIKWELEGLERVDLIAMYFEPTTKAPISLLELGLFRHKPMVVCCPDGYWRKTNVEVTCNRYGVSMVPTLEALIQEVTLRLRA